MLKRKILADESAALQASFGDDGDDGFSMEDSDSSSSSSCYSTEDSEDELGQSEENHSKEKTTRKKSNFVEKTLVLSSRGIISRFRHLMNDLSLLMPHSKKESKFDSKKNLHVLNELVELNNCTSCLFFEVRRHEDLYLWASLCPTGPSVKFHVQNVHSLEELNMTGNCLKGSRPVLSFDESFNQSPHFQLVKGVLTRIFNTPRNHRKSKPFVDRVMSFSILDNRIWIRNYQISDQESEKAKEVDMTMVEIGPRFALNIMKIFDGSFSGSVIYANPDFIAPNELRKRESAKFANTYKARLEKEPRLQQKINNSQLPKDEIDEKVFGQSDQSDDGESESDENESDENESDI